MRNKQVKGLAIREEVVNIFIEVRIIMDINMDFDNEDNVISYLKAVLVNFIAIIIALNCQLAYSFEIIIMEILLEIKESITLNYKISLFMVLVVLMSYFYFTLTFLLTNFPNHQALKVNLILFFYLILIVIIIFFY